MLEDIHSDERKTNTLKFYIRVKPNKSKKAKYLYKKKITGPIHRNIKKKKESENF